MLKETLRRTRNMFKHSDSWQIGYDAGYSSGIDQGMDFGRRVAYNTALTHELKDILQRYNAMITHPKLRDPQAKHTEFVQAELDRMKLELQDRE